MSKTNVRQGTALARHIGESKVAREQQIDANQKLMTAQTSSRKKEILMWLAPTASDLDYYSNELTSALKIRHEGTCRWILSKKAYLEFLASSPSQESLLWVYAQPGTGKTVVSSFLIDQFRGGLSEENSSYVLYFFCKIT